MMNNHSLSPFIQETAIRGENILATLNQQVKAYKKNIGVGSENIRQSVLGLKCELKKSSIKFSAIDIRAWCSNLDTLINSGTVPPEELTELAQQLIETHAEITDAIDIFRSLQNLQNNRSLSFESKKAIATSLLQHLDSKTIGSINAQDLQGILRLIHELQLPIEKELPVIVQCAGMDITSSENFTASNLANIVYYLHSYLIVGNNPDHLDNLDDFHMACRIINKVADSLDCSASITLASSATIILSS